MKKSLWIAGMAIVAVSFLFNACSTTKALTNSDKKGITGTWVLNDINIKGLPAGKFKATVFDDVAYDCFKGSEWVLPGNGNGSYTITSTLGDCYAGKRNIVWSVLQEGQVKYFQFKTLDGTSKAKTITTGYRMQVTDLSETTMQLTSPISFEGKTLNIVYSFMKKEK